jgi:hypothetical protein
MTSEFLPITRARLEEFMRCRPSITGRRKAMFVIASGALAMASCGGGSPSAVLVPAPQQQPAPGYDSPQAAVAGYLTGYTKKNGNMICSYVAPVQDGVCRFLVAGTPYPLVWRIGNSMVRGKEAIVVVLSDKWCAAGTCIRNTDASKGLPSNPRGFERAFDATRNLLPALSVVRVDGKWYVALA